MLRRSMRSPLAGLASALLGRFGGGSVWGQTPGIDLNEWPERHAGPVDFQETRQMMAVEGNVGDSFITGQMNAGFGASRIAAWRFNRDGVLQQGWPMTWPEFPEGPCYGVVAAVDNTGPLYVVGAYTLEGFGTNSVVLKYGIDEQGDGLLDVEVFDLDGECNPNFPVAATFDGTGRLWVVGVRGGCMTGNDYYIWALNDPPGGGDHLATEFVETFDHANLEDVPTDVSAISVDVGLTQTTLIAVTGRSFDSTTRMDIQTLLFSVTGGQLQNETNILPAGGRFNASGTSFDAGTSVTLIQNPNGFVDIYMSGYTRPSVNDDYDYVTIGYVWDANPPPPNDPAFVPWVDVRDGTGGDDVTAKIVCAQDRNNNSSRVVVAGTSWGGASNFDAWILSYTRDGNLQDLRNWRSNFGAEDRLVDMAAINAGDVYIIGRAWNGANYDYRTVRLNSAAATWTTVWPFPAVGGAMIYDVGSGHDHPAAIRLYERFQTVMGTPIDTSDVYVTGRSLGLLDETNKYASLLYLQGIP